jgi:uncharacterized protein YecT (DUF1311 family)
MTCFRAYYGAGEPADFERARGCFERVVAREAPCGGGSPSLARIFLGLMRYDAQGGPRDNAGAQPLFVGCFGDSGVAVAAREREKTGNKKPIDFCEDIGGTTRDMEACGAVQRDREDVEVQSAHQDVVRKLSPDDASLELWKKADTAFAAFIQADAEYASDAYRGGSMRSMQAASILAWRTKERALMLRALLNVKADRPDIEAPLKKIRTQAQLAAKDAENKELFVKAEAAFATYEAAEMAFVERAFAKLYGAEPKARRAAQAELGKRRIAALDAAIKALQGE